MEDIQNDLPELVTMARGILDDLEAAESCETAEDLRENLRQAFEKLSHLKKDIQSALRAASKL